MRWILEFAGALLRRGGRWSLSACHSDEFGQFDEIVGDHRQGKFEIELLEATQHRPRQSPDGLAPAEWLLDLLALALADVIARMAGGAAVDGGAAMALVLRDVRGHLQGAHVGHEVSRIEAFVGTDRDALGARRIAHDHGLRRGALDRTRHLPQVRLHYEAVAVFGHDVANIG